MKKVLVLVGLLGLAACSSSSSGTLSVGQIVGDVEKACNFTPSTEGVIALIDLEPQGTTEPQVVQQICAAVNSVNPPVGPKAVRDIVKGTTLSVVIHASNGPISLIGIVK